MKLKKLLCDLRLIFIFLKLSCTQDCSTRELQPRRTCPTSCTGKKPCKDNLPECKCDGNCGMSCINPNVMCPELANVEKADIERTRGNNYHSIATYTCNNNYVLIGDKTRQCQSDKNWDGSAPTCQSKISTTSTTPAATEDITISTTTTTITTPTTTDDSNIIIKSEKSDVNMTSVAFEGRQKHTNNDLITEDTIPVSTFQPDTILRSTYQPPSSESMRSIWDGWSTEIRAVIISSLVFIAIVLFGCIIKVIKTYCCQHPPKPANI